LLKVHCILDGKLFSLEEKADQQHSMKVRLIGSLLNMSVCQNSASNVGQFVMENRGVQGKVISDNRRQTSMGHG
jgi:hypothetical protein